MSKPECCLQAFHILSIIPCLRRIAESFYLISSFSDSSDTSMVSKSLHRLQAISPSPLGDLFKRRIALFLNLSPALHHHQDSGKWELTSKYLRSDNSSWNLPAQAECFYTRLILFWQIFLGHERPRRNCFR